MLSNAELLYHRSRMCEEGCGDCPLYGGNFCGSAMRTLTDAIGAAKRIEEWAAEHPEFPLAPTELQIAEQALASAQKALSEAMGLMKKIIKEK